MQSFHGKNEPRNYYIVTKGNIKRTEYFNVFAAHQLKAACADILGMDEEAARRSNSNDLARKVWYGTGKH